MAKPRCILRLEVSPHVPKALATTVDRWGTTNVSIATRLAEWLVRQDDETVAQILGLYPGGIRRNLPMRVVKAMGKSAKDHGR